MKPCLALPLVVYAATGCIDIPALPACLADQDCGGGQVCGPDRVCVPGEPDATTDAMPDATPDAMPHAMPDATPDATLPVPDGCPPLGDVDEGPLRCVVRGETFVIPPVAYPAADPIARHVALASAGTGGVAVAWTDPPADCDSTCSCPGGETPCPACEPCGGAFEEAIWLACLDQDFTRPVGRPHDWGRAEQGVVVAQVPTHHQIHLEWSDGLGAYILTWSELDWSAYDPDAPERAGPAAIGVALFDRDCGRIGDEVFIPQDEQCYQHDGFHDPRVWWDQDADRVGEADGSIGEEGGRFRLVAGDLAGGVCLSSAASLDGLACLQDGARPCNAYDRAVFAAGETFDWAVVRANHLGSARYDVLLAKRAQYLWEQERGQRSQRLVDHNDHRPDGEGYEGAIAYVEEGLPFAFQSVAAVGTPAGPVRSDDGGLAVAWAAASDHCTPVGHATWPVYLHHVDPRALENGAASNGALSAPPGRGQGAMVRLANALSVAHPQVSAVDLAYDAARDTLYLTRRRPSGIWLSKVDRAGPDPEAELLPRGIFDLGEGVRSRIAVIDDGDVAAAIVSADGTIRVRRHDCGDDR